MKISPRMCMEIYEIEKNFLRKNKNKIRLFFLILAVFIISLSVVSIVVIGWPGIMVGVAAAILILPPAIYVVKKNRWRF